MYSLALRRCATAAQSNYVVPRDLRPSKSIRNSYRPFPRFVWHSVISTSPKGAQRPRDEMLINAIQTKETVYNYFIARGVCIASYISACHYVNLEVS